MPSTPKSFRTWQDHILTKIDEFRRFEYVHEIRDAFSWILENLPERRESVLIHGDLLGQNILKTLEEEIYVIDWEYAFVGNPAYDLAIVTRGVKNPFKFYLESERVARSIFA